MGERVTTPIPAPTPAILSLASVLLSRAAERYGRHGCNDFEIGTVPGFTTKKARIELDRQMHAWNGDPDEHDPKNVSTTFSDSFLMAFCAAVLRNNTGATIEPKPSDIRADQIELQERRLAEAHAWIANVRNRRACLDEEEREQQKRIAEAECELKALRREESR